VSENLDPLNLPGLKTEKRTDNGDHFALRVRVIAPTAPRCCLLQNLLRRRGILLGRMPPVGSADREKLEDWFARWPILRDAFEAKEDIVALYSCSSAQSAQQWYAGWQEKLSPALAKDFRPVVTAFRNWNSEIMAYFDHPQTNAYLESVNSLIAALDRNGRGYAFETIRAKALLSYGIHKASKPKFQRRPTSVTSEMIIGLELDRPVNLGADIDLLTAAISTPGAFSGSKMLKRPINH
jgi:transposase